MSKRHRSGAYKPVRATRGVRKGAGGAKAAKAANARNRMVNVPRNKLGFPQSMSTKLRFVTRVDFDVGTTTQHIAFNANGMYDPLVALGGHQPRGFDEYMDLYTTYTVTSSTIGVNLMYQGYDGPATESSTTGEMIKTWSVGGTDQPALSPVVCGLHKGLKALTAGAAEIQMEKDRTQWRIMSPNSGPVILGGKLAVSDFYGKGKLVGAAGYTGDKSNNPSELVFWDLWCARASGTAPGECKVVGYATIEFTCVFTEPVTLAAS